MGKSKAPHFYGPGCIAGLHRRAMKRRLS